MGNGYGDKLVHQICFEHESETIDELCKAFSANELLIGNEYHFDKYTQTYNYKGRIAVNINHVGKIKEA